MPSSSTSPPTAFPTSSSFLAAAFRELLQEDGLLVLGRGLGLRLVLAKFLRLYSDRDRWGNRLVFCLNASGEERLLLDALLDEGCPPSSLPTTITNETSTKERASLFKRGGVFIVTSRILIVDLLNRVVDPATVHGLLVHDAHRDPV